jgi:hypothetical protein
MITGSEKLKEAVAAFTREALLLTDEDLERAWQWGEYDEGLRFAFCRVYETLRKLAADLAGHRQAAGAAPTRAQSILAQYNAAYRDLQAVLLPVDDALAEKRYNESEWSVRIVLRHIVETDLSFQTVNEDALTRRRLGELNPPRLTEADWEALEKSHPYFKVAEQGPASALVEVHQQIHERVIRTYTNATEEELETLVWFWESTPMPLWFRLHRFDSHLRQHTLQVEKTLEQLGCRPDEVQRLLRYIFNAQAEVEGAQLGLNLPLPAKLGQAVEEVHRYTEAIQAGMRR